MRPTLRPAALLPALLALLLPLPAAALDCRPGDGRAAVELAGEVGGAHAFSAPLGPGWRFALEPAERGYELRLYDGTGRDLTAGTPPAQGPNPRELYGWHFRNADNSGMNDGSVNAPQRLRLFHFDPAGPGAAADAGRGWLELLDLGLADLEPGQRARLVYLRFRACLTWPQERPPQPPPLTVSPETEEVFRACGLPAGYRIAARLNRVELGGDFDGDGALDQAVLVRRDADGRYGLALCRAGTWLDLVGFDGPIGALLPAYFGRIDWWALTPAGPVGQGAGGAPPPTLQGDGITLGKEDSSSVLLYWTPEGYRSYWQGD